MTYKEYKELTSTDLRLYTKYSNHICRVGGLKRFIASMTSPGWNICLWHRRVDYFRNKKIFLPLWLYARWKYRRVCIKFGCDIPSSVRIGKGFVISHTCGIVINGGAVIGEFVCIKSGLCIGIRGTGDYQTDGAARISDNVDIGANVSIIGPVKIGKGVKIGAGSVVVKDVPAGVTIVGNPAHVIGSKVEL